MNELLDIVNKLNDRYDAYGSGKHWEVVKAEKIGHYENETDGWTLTIKPAKEEKDGGAANESNE